MILNILKYTILGLFILNIPSVILVHANPVLANMLSILSYLLLAVYYILVPKSSLNHWMILLGLIYYSISSLSGQAYLPETTRDFIVVLVKFFIIAIPGYELLKRVSKNELLVFLLLGAISIVFQIMYFYDPLRDYGRYSGFYLNPNEMGFICLMGYGLTFGLNQKKLRLFAQIIFTIMGLLTFSRTFMIVWLLMNIVSLRLSLKNIRVFIYGVILLMAVLTYNQFLPVQNTRIEQLSALLSGESVSDTGLTEDSRMQTWSHYYGALMEKPFFGHGFRAFGGHTKLGEVGAHNFYIKILGEAGIITFLVFLLYLMSLIKECWRNFNARPHLFMMSLAYILYLATNHNFFDNGYLMFMLLWLYAGANEPISTDNSNSGDNKPELELGSIKVS